MEVAEAGERLANLSLSGTPRKNGGEGKTTRVRLPSGQDQEMTQSDQARFNKLVTKGKQLASDGRIREALELNKRALNIYHSEKLAKRVAKMEGGLPPLSYLLLPHLDDLPNTPSKPPSPSHIILTLG